MQEQEIVDGGQYQVKVEGGVTSLTIKDVVQEDCDKYTIVVHNSIAAHAAFASLAVGSKLTVRVEGFCFGYPFP